MTISALFNVGVIQEILVKYRIVPNSLSSKSLKLAPVENRYTFRFPSLRISKSNGSFFKRTLILHTLNFIFTKQFPLSALEVLPTQKSIKQVMYLRWEYFFILSVFLPLSKGFILRMLRR